MRSQHNWARRMGASGLRARAFAVGSIALLYVLTCASSGARAAETIYWGNYNSDSLAFANASGSGGGELNNGGATVFEPEGMAIDSAGGRIYWANQPEGEIIATSVRGGGPIASAGPGEGGSIGFANLDGSGAGGLLDTGAAPMENPIGVTIDPVARIIYWSNRGANSIGFAGLDGGGAGELNTAGATVSQPGAIAIDVAGGRLYWANGQTQTIGYANLDGSGGGGELNLAGATTPQGISGLALDPTAGRIYWVDAQSGLLSYANLDGSGGGDMDSGLATVDQPYGAALDPVSGRMYWGNYGRGSVREGAISYANVAAVEGGDVTISLAPVSGPQYPVILQPPSGTGAPKIAGGPAVGSTLGCSRGSWGEDFAGSFVYRAPRGYSYQWSLNGEPIVDATATSYTTSLPGTYVCTVTATNFAGSAVQSSAQAQVGAATTSLATSTSSPDSARNESISVIVTVNCCACAKRPKATKLRLAMDLRKAEVHAGEAAVFVGMVRNTSGAPVKGFRVCAHLWGRAKRELWKPRCVWVPHLAAGQERRLKLRVPTRRDATGDYVVRFVPAGRGASRSVKAKVVVLSAAAG